MIEHASQLFLKSQQLADLVILHPQWLMSMMKIIMELTMTNSEIKVDRIKIQTLERDGIADEELLKECWKMTTELCIDQICSIFQAYCLIHPIPSKEHEIKKYIIPSKLPKELTNTRNQERVDRISKCCNTIYFDFRQFLPDEIYYRLICLLLANSCPSKDSYNCYSKKLCLFYNIFETNWIVEHEENTKRIKFMFV